MKKILIIIPTLNENRNVTIIFDQIKKFQKKSDILFIDDNSTDGTKEEILHLRNRSKKVFYLFRKNKKGIGSAHKDGIKWAYNKKYRYICTMDCDGAHHPKDISKMLKKIEYCDVVSTNRFLKKNSLVKWSLNRILITKMRYFLVRFLLGTKLDSSEAFRLYDSKKIKLKDILYAKDMHYNYFWESFFFLEKKYLIKEISVTLPVRSLGKSKMNLNDIIFGLLYLIKTHIKYIYRK